MHYIEKIDIESTEENLSNYTAKYGIFPLLAWFFQDFIEIREKLKILSVKRKRSNTKKIRKYKSTFSGPDMALGIIAIILLGIKSLEEIDLKLHTEEELAKILGLKRFFDKTYARKFLGEFSLFHLKQLEKINTMVLKEFGDSFNQQIGILDLDLAIHSLKGKRNPSAMIGDNGNKTKNYHYMWSISSIKEEIISQKLEQKEDNTCQNFIWLIEDAMTKLRLKTMIIRTNGKYMSPELLTYCAEKGSQIITHVDWDSLFSNNENLDTNNLKWVSFREETEEKGVKVIKHVKIADIGERFIYSTCEYKFKTLLVEIEKERIRIKKRRKRLKYVIIHNIHGLKGERAIFEFYNQRQTIENIFRESKNPFSSGKMPSQKFRANEAYLNFVILAYNLFTIFKKNVCPIYEKDTLIEHIEI